MSVGFLHQFVQQSGIDSQFIFDAESQFEGHLFETSAQIFVFTLQPFSNRSFLELLVANLPLDFVQFRLFVTQDTPFVREHLVQLAQTELFLVVLLNDDEDQGKERG